MNFFTAFCLVSGGLALFRFLMFVYIQFLTADEADKYYMDSEGRRWHVITLGGGLGGEGYRIEYEMPSVTSIALRKYRQARQRGNL